MMQLDTFLDERMKILYALSFMCGGMVQVWQKTRLIWYWPTHPLSPPCGTPGMY